MIIKPSAALRNEYSTISNLAHTTEEPVYITKNGEGDLVVMSIEAFEKRDEILQMRARVLAAEASRLAGEKTYSIEEVFEHLEKRYE